MRIRTKGKRQGRRGGEGGEEKGRRRRHGLNDGILNVWDDRSGGGGGTGWVDLLEPKAELSDGIFCMGERGEGGMGVRR